MTPAEANTIMGAMAAALPDQDRARFQAMEPGMDQMMNQAHMFDGNSGAAMGSMTGSTPNPMTGTGTGSMMGGAAGR